MTSAEIRQLASRPVSEILTVLPTLSEKDHSRLYDVLFDLDFKKFADLTAEQLTKSLNAAVRAGCETS